MPNQTPHKAKRDSHSLAKRLGTYGGRAAQLTHDLPDTKAGRQVRDQLSRSAMAPGAHYAEARSAQSHDDFVHKVALAAKEVRESLHWLRVALDAEMVEARDVRPLIGEADELVAILFSSLQTARTSQAGDGD